MRRLEGAKLKRMRRMEGAKFENCATLKALKLKKYEYNLEIEKSNYKFKHLTRFCTFSSAC